MSARGPARKGLHYCSMCGKRGRTAEAVEQHIADLHRGEGTALKEPSRATLLAAYLAAEDLADAVHHERNMVCQDFDLQQQASDAVDRTLAAYRRATGASE